MLEIEKALTIDSLNMEFLLTKAKILSAMEADNQSIQILKPLLEKGYKSDTISYLIAINYFNKGENFQSKLNNKDSANKQYREALNYFSNSINLNSQYYKAYLGKIIVLHNLNMYDQALLSIFNAINKFKDKMELVAYRGTEKYSLNDYTGAIYDLDVAIDSKKLDSFTLAKAHRFRALSYWKIENHELAIRDFSEAIKYNPKDYYLYFGRGRCYRDKGLKNYACEDFRKAADLGYIGLYEMISEYCNE
jgi:tetratricopeptide (TPR) repeat protein